MKAKLRLILPPLVVAVLAVLGYSQFTGIEGVGFIYTVRYDGDMNVLWAVLDAFSDGTAVRIVFEADGVEIPHSDRMRLMGDADSAWNIGDWLPLHKEDGIWREMTRYLK